MMVYLIVITHLGYFLFILIHLRWFECIKWFLISNQLLFFSCFLLLWFGSLNRRLNLPLIFALSWWYLFNVFIYSLILPHLLSNFCLIFKISINVNILVLFILSLSNMAINQRQRLDRCLRRSNVILCLYHIRGGISSCLICKWIFAWVEAWLIINLINLLSLNIVKLRSWKFDRLLLLQFSLNVLCRGSWFRSNIS